MRGSPETQVREKRDEDRKRRNNNQNSKEQTRRKKGGISNKAGYLGWGQDAGRTIRSLVERLTGRGTLISQYVGGQRHRRTQTGKSGAQTEVKEVFF